MCLGLIKVMTVRKYLIHILFLLVSIDLCFDFNSMSVHPVHKKCWCMKQTSIDIEDSVVNRVYLLHAWNVAKNLTQWLTSFSLNVRNHKRYNSLWEGEYRAVRKCHITIYYTCICMYFIRCLPDIVSSIQEPRQIR